MNKVWALNDRGQLTKCSVPPEERGKGRCNHIDHQKDGESVESFMERVNSRIKIDNLESNEIKNQKEAIDEIVRDNSVSFNKNPNWESVIKNKINNYFIIGKEENYEEVNIDSIDQNHIKNENGDPVIELTGNFIFRGESYKVNLGQIPEVQEDGTIIMNGSHFRVLPVLSQFKSGLIRYKDKSVARQSNGNIAIIMEPGNDNVKIHGKDVPIEEVEKYFRGEDCNLTEIQKKDIDNIDPVLYERFPNFKSDMRSVINNHEEDMPNDISYRKVLTYEDQVRFELDKQMRRMGVTFRTNLDRQTKAKDNGNYEEIKEKYPLFYQKNITENVRKELTGRSNVQLADNLNPLSALSQSHKISLTGPGGYNKDKAPVMLRQVGESHKGLIDSMDVSSGKNIGLTISLENADVDSRGFIVKSTAPKLAVSDFIPYKLHNDANRACMAVAHMKQAVPIAGGEDPKLVGDESDKAWNKIKGSKLGANLNVAYCPEAGTHEDSVIISESAAKRMMTKQSYDYTTLNNESKLKIGQEVIRGQYINGAKIKYNGKIKSIDGNKIKVESTFNMGVGDKLAGRHGNKSTVSKVLPDDKMPKIFKNGKYEPADVIMSPLSVVGRMNLGQVYETNNGVLNKKTFVKLPNGHEIHATAGTQFIMRLNHIAEKKIQSYQNQQSSSKESKGMRFGEMESLLLSSTPERREVLNYLRTQENSDAINRMNNLLKSVGVNVNFNNK